MQGFGPQVREKYLELIREGVMRGAAATELGLDRRQVREYIEENPDFEGEVEDAEVDATEHVRAALYAAAVSGSVPAARAWLEMNGVEFAERRGRPSNPDIPPGPDQFAPGFGTIIPLDPARRNKGG